MIEVYFHTMQMLKEIINPNDRVFYSHADEMGYDPLDDDKWLLSPGIVDTGLGGAIDLPMNVVPNSMGIGILDGADGETQFFGTIPIIVTISLLVPIKNQSLWFRAKDTSTNIRRLATMSNAANDFSSCDITPSDYDISSLITDGTSVYSVESSGREIIIPDIDNQQELWVFYRSFIFTMSINN